MRPALARGRGRAGGALLLVTLALAGCKRGPPGGEQQGEAGKAMPVDVLELKPGPVRDTTEYLGTLISRSNITLNPQVGGYLSKIDVRPGARVREGQRLMVVDPRREEAALRGAEAERTSAVANRNLARQDFRRISTLFKQGVVTRQDFDQAQARIDAAEAAVHAAEAQLQSRRVQLGFFEVTAPFAGTVGDIPVKVGDYVTAQTVLTDLTQSNALDVAVAVPVERARKVRIGMTPVEVLDDEGKPVVRAPVYFVAPTPEARTQLVLLRAGFDNTVNLRAGQLVRARVVFDTREALRLPTYAVARQSGQDFALVVAQGDGGGPVVHLTPVKLGEVEGNYFEVKSGLKPGDKVAVGSVQLLRDGQPIQPRPVAEGQQPGVGGGADAGE
ncbi:efflux RND transporter periplasmic adaptor subunit [Myxococcaceae bacterium GXIMD 01537]